ncbi:MAG: glutamate racemase [Defluviitaleaceae bacterium]|nr:glutamate racemase [Defluviitaleaceae bacterium]
MMENVGQATDTAKEKAIGIFDSGVGGLTVAGQIMKKLPNERIVYFGDSKRAPYGNKSVDILEKYSKEIVDFLKEKDIKVLVIGCGTISASCYKAVCGMIDVPVFEMVSPAVIAGLGIAENNRLGLIATEAAIKAGTHAAAFAAANPNIEIISKACPMFVPLVEEGWIDNALSDMAAERYLSCFLNPTEILENESEVKTEKISKIDGLILGCTHYPLLQSSIVKVMGDIPLIDPAAALAQILADYMGKNGLLNTANTANAATNTDELPKLLLPKHKFYASANKKHFQKIGKLITGHSLDVEIFEIDEDY